MLLTSSPKFAKEIHRISGKIADTAEPQPVREHIRELNTRHAYLCKLVSYTVHRVHACQLRNATAEGNPWGNPHYDVSRFAFTFLKNLNNKADLGNTTDEIKFLARNGIRK